MLVYILRKKLNAELTLDFHTFNTFNIFLGSKTSVLIKHKLVNSNKQ